MKVLVTCPPMIGIRGTLSGRLAHDVLEFDYAEVVQTLSVDELISLVPKYDGWIIGDDPATAAVFEAGKAGKLRAAVKWGVGVDNVDFAACTRLGISIDNTPAMFGNEVADIAIGYIIGLARHTFRIDREVRLGRWPKYRGVSLEDKKVALVGCGDIGFQVARRLDVMGCEILVYDPFISEDRLTGLRAHQADWPIGLGDCDFVVFTSALTPETRHMLNEEVIGACKDGVRIVNVSRGGLIHQPSLINALSSGKVGGVALDVFEDEPLGESPLQQNEMTILGSHNASNTEDAVIKTSLLAITKLKEGLST